jgi:outer membrane protein assembly factor BamB
LGDLDARKARLAAISKEKGFVYAGKEAGYDLYTGMYSLPTASTVGYEDRNQAEAKKHVALRGELYAKYGFNYEQWRGWLGNTYRTPISDGACVFVAMAYGQVACYDLDGDLKWMQWLPPGGKDHTWRAGDAQPAQECGHTPSPILVGDRLIVQGKGFGNARNTGRNNRVVALDKRTGKVLWEYNTKSNLKRDVGAPVAMTVNGVELVVLSTGVVLQATDGKVLSEDVIAMPGTRIGCMATNGDQVFFNWCASTDGQREKNFIDAFRFTYGAEGFSATRLWTAAVPNCDRVGSTLADGTLYTGTYALYTVNAADGVVTQVLKDQKNRRLDGNTPPSVAGGKVYWVGGQSDGGRVIVSTAGTNASTIGASTIVCDARFDFDKAKRGTMPLDDYLQKYGGDKDRFPTVFAMCGGPFFQGDRMYLRSAEYLYCIGTAPKTDGK